MTRVSVLITTYNGERFIGEQLLSIFDQTCPVDEVLICDDGSSDETVPVVRQFLDTHACSNWRLVINERNLGPSANVLSHLGCLRGDLIFLSDQDDVWEPEKVRTIVSAMDSNESLVLVASRVSFIDAVGRRITSIRAFVGASPVGAFRRSRQIRFNEFLGFSKIPLHSMCIRRSVSERLDNLTSLPLLDRSLGADWYIGICSTLLGPCLYVPERLVKRRIHDSNISLGRLRKTTALASSLPSRLAILDEAMNAHRLLLSNLASFQPRNPRTAQLLQRVLTLYALRIDFTRRPTAELFARLLGKAPSYLMCAGSFAGALRMVFGDFLYAFQINPNLVRKKRNA